MKSRVKVCRRSLLTRAAAVGLSVSFTAAGCSDLLPSEAEETASTAQALSSPGVSSANLQLQELTASCAANGVQDTLKVINNGSTSVALSDVTIKFWVNDTSGKSVVPHVNSGGCLTTSGGSCVHQVSGASAVATPFSPACGPDAAHRANTEITISNTDPTLLGPGASWANVQAALNLADFSNFIPGATSWYSPCLGGVSYVNDSHYAVYFKGDLVFSSGLNAPTCRSPVGQQQLHGYIPSAMSSGLLVGPVPGTTPIHLAIGLPVTNPQGLQSLIQQVSDPTSPSYRQYLTVSQFAASFGPTSSDYQALTTWAQSNGLSVDSTASNRLLLDVSGPASAIEKALFANLVNRKRADGSNFYMLDREPSLNLAVPVLRISGLDNFFVPKPLVGSGVGGTFQGVDFRNAYAACTTLTGTNQSVGLFQFDGFSASDVTTYEAISAIPNVPVTPVLLDGVSGAPSMTNGSIEAALDIEMVISMAPGLSQVLVFEGTSGNDIMNAMATKLPLSNQLSSSWEWGSDDNTNQITSAMAVQGQSFFQSSGDLGSFPSDPGNNKDVANITIVGGTVLSMNGTGVSYQSESAWPSSGGGILTSVPIPDYQQGISMTASNGSTAKRNAPDVAMIAQNIRMVGNGGALTVSGTSAATPLWAGFMALVNQQNQALGLGVTGFANPVFYAIAKTPAVYSTSFNDVTTGSNGGFAAVPGYDLTTGLGSPACGLINQLASPAPLTPPPSFNLIELSIGTGGDDLRGDSIATVDLFAPGAATPFQTISLKDSTQAAWQFASMHDIVVPLSGPLPAGGIGKITMHLIQNAHFPETDDNWNIESLQVRLVNASGPEACVIDRFGDPVVRLTGSVGSATFVAADGCPIAPSPPAAPSVNVHAVELIINTGGDDLRADSEAFVSLFTAGAAQPFQTLQVKSSADVAWAGGSVHDFVVALIPAMPFSAIDHVVVSLAQHGSFPETDDNWDIEGISLMAFNPGDLQSCVLDMVGDPVVELTGSVGSASFAAHGGCP